MPATFSKPTKTARWADTGTRVEPSEAKKDTGWVFEEVPPFSFFNYLQGITGDWHQWLGERLADGVDENEFVIRNPNDGSVGIRIKSDGHLEIPSQAIDETDLAVNDAFFRLNASVSGQRALIFDQNDELRFDRSTGELSFNETGFTRVRLDGAGIAALRVAAGSGPPSIASPNAGGFGLLSAQGDGSSVAFMAFREDDLGAISAAPEQYWRMRGLSGELAWEVNTSTTSPFLTFAEVFRLQNDVINAALPMTIGFVGDPPSSGLKIEDDLFVLFNNTLQPQVQFDAGDRYAFDRAADNHFWQVGGTTEMSLVSTGLRVANGIFVGDATSTPFDNDLVLAGGVNAGGSVNPAAGEGIFTDGIVVGFDGNAGAGEVRVGDADFKLDHVSATDVRVQFDTGNDYLRYDRSADEAEIVIGGTQVLGVQSTGALLINGFNGAGDIAIGGAGANGITFNLGDPGDEAAIRANTAGEEITFSLQGIFAQHFVMRHAGGAATTDGFRIGTNVSDNHALYMTARASGGNPGGIFNSAQLFAKEVGTVTEMYVRDENGNVTQISPHDPETGEHYLHSENEQTGRRIKIWLERLARRIEEMTGDTFLEEEWVQPLAANQSITQGGSQ